MNFFTYNYLSFYNNNINIMSCIIITIFINKLTNLLLDITMYEYINYIARGNELYELQFYFRTKIT